MTPYDINQAAFRRLKPSIDQTYPHGRFVAIDAGQIVADDRDIGRLIRTLSAKGLNPKEVLVIQAGDEYPDYAHILH